MKKGGNATKSLGFEVHNSWEPPESSKTTSLFDFIALVGLDSMRNDDRGVKT